MATKVKLGTDAQWGVKENGVLGFNDENGVFKAIELSSSRASSGTYVAESGLIADAEVGVPRIDWTNGVGELLLEPQSTNLVTTSNNGSYGGGGSPTSEINEISPSGENNAVRPVPSVTTNRYEHTISGGTYATNTKITYSWYRKRLSYPDNDSFVGDLNITALVNCTQQGSTTEIESNINGYDRFQAVFNITDGSLSTTLRLYYGDVVGVGNSSVAYWGHQVEPLSYATSLIQTSGTSVTRIADAVTGNSSLGQVINSSEGVLYFEGSGLANDSTNRYITLNDGSSNNRVSFLLGANTNQIRSVIYDGTTEYDYSDYTAGSLSNFKYALKYKASDFAVWINGSELDSQLSGATFSVNTLSSISFDLGNGTLPFYGRIRELKVYDTALTDAQLQTLTTL